MRGLADGDFARCCAMPTARSCSCRRAWRARSARPREVLRKPDRIGLVWVRGLDGRMMLVRRYSSAEGVVDVGGSFWRWAVGASRACRAAA
jgi:hypothetical protein